MPHHFSSRANSGRHATTLPELVVVVALVALICGLALPPFKRTFDRIQTRGAAREAMMAFFTARAHAIALGRRTTVMLDANGGRVVVLTAGDTLMVRPVSDEHGVTMTTTRDSMAFFPDGLGLGAANVSVIFSRGNAVDTVIVSREGRVKLGAKAR